MQWNSFAAAKLLTMQLETLRRELQRQPFHPLFATLSGAHLYGFESPDSDLDLRGAFVLEAHQLIGLKSPQETVCRSYLEQGLEMDLVCHDIAKYCRLVLKRSGEILEQLYSPLVVWPDPALEELRELARPYILRDTYYHYRGFLSNQLRFIDRPDSTVKEMLYGYRVALTGIHLMTRGEVLSHLPSLLELNPQKGVDELLTLKRTQPEKGPLPEPLRHSHRHRLTELDDELKQAFENSSLPTQAPPVDRLHDFVVALRTRPR